MILFEHNASTRILTIYSPDQQNRTLVDVPNLDFPEALKLMEAVKKIEAEAFERGKKHLARSVRKTLATELPEF